MVRFRRQTAGCGCLVSSNVERYFVDLAAKADDAVLRTLEHKTLADTLSELRILDAAR